MSIYKSAVNRPVTTALVFVAIVIFGLFSLTRLSIDLLPDIEVNVITVVTSYPGAGAEDIENAISRPIENTLNTVTGLKHISSTSKENFSVVSLEFDAGVDISEAMNDVRDKLDLVVSVLPEEANKPMLFRFGTENIPIMVIGASATESAKGLYKILDEKVSNRLARIDGVGQISVAGAPKREINIYIDPMKLEAYNLTVEQVAQAIRLANANVPIGTIDVGSKTISLRMEGEIGQTEELSTLIVSSEMGRMVYLRDVAQVVDGDQERMQETTTNGNTGAIVTVYKQSGSNSVKIANRINKELSLIRESLPSDVSLDIVIDTSKSIRQTINSLLETILITFAVVMLVVFLFLGRWRATIIIVLTIPISLIASMIYLMASGSTLNVISLSALSIAIGMVVDDAIVVLENITTHIERGSYPKQAGVHATSEVSLSVVASTLTMLAVFLPLTLVTGLTGVLFRQLGWVVSIVMIVSTVAALSLTPMMSARLLRRTQRNSPFYDRFFKYINATLSWLEKNYSHLIDWCVRHRKTTVASAAAVLFASLLLIPMVKTEFMPESDGGVLNATIEFPQGYGIAYARDFTTRFEKELREKYPDIDFIVFQMGQPDEDNAFAAFGTSGSNVINMYLSMLPYEKRSMTTSQLADKVRADLSHYTELESFTITMGNGPGGQAASVGMQIFGYDFDATDRVAAEYKALIEESPACAEATLSRKPRTPELQVHFDNDKLALYGLTRTTAATSLRNAINGIRNSYFREDGDEYYIRVRYAPRYRENIDAIENILISTPVGSRIRLKDLGEVRQGFAPPAIERRDRERYLEVSSTVASGYALSDLVQASQEAISKVELPEDVRWKIGGTFENQQESFKDLFTLMILIILLVFIVMAAEFESLVDPFVIMFSVPFALTGVLLGFVLTGTPMGVMSLIGAIMLIGIVVKNGIVLIDYTILCRERGMGVIRSVVSAARSRLRPVLMTTATTVLGMIPLAIGTGEGSNMWRGMGITVAFGLTVSTLITLVIVPTIYTIFAGNGIKRARRSWRKRARRKEQDRSRALAAVGNKSSHSDK